MNLEAIDIKIDEAWLVYYNGQHKVAFDMFTQIVVEQPDHLDANWGLGLVNRKLGNKQEARRVFGHVQSLVTIELESDSKEYERVFMLKRMVDQQIDYMNEFMG